MHLNANMRTNNFIVDVYRSWSAFFGLKVGSDVKIQRVVRRDSKTRAVKRDVVIRSESSLNEAPTGLLMVRGRICAYLFLQTRVPSMLSLF